MLKDEEGAVLDYIQVFNSVEVIAPGIEIDSPRRRARPQTQGKHFTPIFRQHSKLFKR